MEQDMTMSLSLTARPGGLSGLSNRLLNEYFFVHRGLTGEEAKKRTQYSPRLWYLEFCPTLSIAQLLARLTYILTLRPPFGSCTPCNTPGSPQGIARHAEKPENTQSAWRKKSSEPDPDVTQMLELSGREFKTTIINMLGL